MISLLSSLFLAFFHALIYIWAFIITLIRPVQAQVKKLTRRQHVQCQGCIVVVSPTFYKSTSEVRFTLAQRLASQVRRAGMTWIVVDASPGEEVRDALQSYGAIVHREQPSSEGKGKGVGLRQAIKAAVTYIEEESRQPGSTVTLANSIIVAMEPEKESFLDFVPDLIVPIVRDQADVVLPTRRTMHTLPREQYHSESFGNAHLNNVAREVGFPDNIDWYFGPFLWRASLSPYWLAYRGLLWESQIVPYIYAWKEKQARIVAQIVDFTYPREQKLEEEGNATWSGKRLFQLHHLIPHIVDALRDEVHPSSTFNGPTSSKRR